MHWVASFEVWALVGTGVDMTASAFDVAIKSGPHASNAILISCPCVDVYVLPSAISRPSWKRMHDNSEGWLQVLSKSTRQVRGFLQCAGVACKRAYCTCICHGSPLWPSKSQRNATSRHPFPGRRWKMSQRQPAGSTCVSGRVFLGRLSSFFWVL